MAQHNKVPGCYLAIAVPMPVYPIAGTWGFTLNVSVLDVGLAKITGLLTEALPVAGRLVGFTASALFPSSIAPDSLDPTYSKIQQNLLAQVTKQGLLNKGYNVTAMPADVVSAVPTSEIGKLPTAPANVLAQNVIDVDRNVTALAITAPMSPTSIANIPVVKAVRTKVPGVYSANIIAGQPAFQVKVDTTKPAVAKHPPKVNDSPAVSSFVSSSVRDTYHAFVDFGGDHDPVYVSVTKRLTKEQEKQLIEEAKKREQEWLKKHPEAVAERELATRAKELDEAKTNRDKINAQIAQAKSELVKAEDAVTHAEQRRKDAEQKAKDEKEKKRQGVKDKGHEYHPVPETEEITGLGELQERPGKTPKQG